MFARRILLGPAVLAILLGGAAPVAAASEPRLDLVKTTPVCEGGQYVANLDGSGTGKCVGGPYGAAGMQAKELSPGAQGIYAEKQSGLDNKAQQAEAARHNQAEASRNAYDNGKPDEARIYANSSNDAAAEAAEARQQAAISRRAQSAQETGQPVNLDDQ